LEQDLKRKKTKLLNRSSIWQQLFRRCFQNNLSRSKLYLCITGDNNKAIDLSSSLFFLYLKRVEIYLLQNNDDSALADFVKTLELNPKFGRGYIGITKLYTKRRDKEKAVENYKFAKQYDIKYNKFTGSEIKIFSKNK
jgi:tetratricopeptide (TPR) repeat protein